MNHFFDSQTCVTLPLSISASSSLLLICRTSDNDAAFFRVVPGFVVQFGIPGNPAVSAAWADATIDNDAPVTALSNVRGTLAYAAEQDAQGQATGRTTQLFVNLGDNSFLDKLGFTVVGVLDEASTAAIEAVSDRWGELPDQDLIYRRGNAYLRESFPGLDFIGATEVEVHVAPLEPPGKTRTHAIRSLE